MDADTRQAAASLAALSAAAMSSPGTLNTVAHARLLTSLLEGSAIILQHQLEFLHNQSRQAKRLYDANLEAQLLIRTVLSHSFAGANLSAAASSSAGAAAAASAGVGAVDSNPGSSRVDVRSADGLTGPASSAFVQGSAKPGSGSVATGASSIELDEKKAALPEPTRVTLPRLTSVGASGSGASSVPVAAPLIPRLDDDDADGKVSDERASSQAALPDARTTLQRADSEKDDIRRRRLERFDSGSRNAQS